MKPTEGLCRPISMHVGRCHRAGIIAVLLATAFLTSCGNDQGPSAASSQQPTGTVTGQLMLVGGPAPGAPVPLTGTVTAQGRGSDHVATTDSHGRFSFNLPVGSYLLSGHSPKYDDGNGTCNSEAQITVQPHRVQQVNVLCQAA